MWLPSRSNEFIRLRASRFLAPLREPKCKKPESMGSRKAAKNRKGRKEEVWRGLESFFEADESVTNWEETNKRYDAVGFFYLDFIHRTHKQFCEPLALVSLCRKSHFHHIAFHSPHSA